MTNEQITDVQVVEAIESLDDFARMMAGVNPKGPRELLYRYVAQVKQAAQNLEEQNEAGWAEVTRLAGERDRLTVEASRLRAQVLHLVDDLTEEVAGEEEATYYRLRDGKDVLFSNMVGACARLLAAPEQTSGSSAAAPVVGPSLTVGDGDARDAARYRWLRLKVYIDPRELILRIQDTFLSEGATVPEMLDAAIDAALPSQPAAQAEPVADPLCPINLSGGEWAICESAINESRARYTLATSRAAFQAGALYTCRAALAVAHSNPPAQGTGELPPLPTCNAYIHAWIDGKDSLESANRNYYTADQMQAYARAALAQVQTPSA